MFRPTAERSEDGTACRDLAAILESFPANIAYLDKDLVYRFVNSQYETLFARRRQDIVGHHVQDVLGPSGYAVAGPRLRHALAGEVHSYDAEFQFPDRPPCWLAVHYIPDHGADGAVRGLFVFAVDISRRRRAESDLQRAEVRFRTLYEHAPIGIGYYDREGRVVQLNHHSAAELGVGVGDLIGRTLGEILGSEIAAPFEARMREVLASGVAQEHLDEVVLPAGSRWFLSNYAAMPGADGTFAGVQVVSRDITALKRAEQEAREGDLRLRQSQKMQAVGVMAGGVAHDFNNILQTVLGFTLEMLDDPDLPELHREDLDVVRDACRRGASLTSQLLAFSRQQLLYPQVLDANDVVRSVFKMIRRLIGEDIVLEVEATAPECLVRADEGQLSQILINLAVNARDAMPGGGTLRISTGHVEIDAALDDGDDHRAGSYLVVTVADTGCGMASEVRDRIFEPFFTTKEVGHGTGLGLATVFGIVHQHGGFIEVDSAPGEGSTFRVCLPLFQAPSRDEAGDAAVRVAGGEETILLGEDDAHVRQVLERRLRRAGYRVLAACDGAQAVALHESHAGDIDLAILDMVMPGCAGRQAYEAMQRRAPDLKVIFISGYPATEGVNAVAAGESFLRKPFTADDLCRAVREVLDGVAAPA